MLRALPDSLVLILHIILYIRPSLLIFLCIQVLGRNIFLPFSEHSSTSVSSSIFFLGALYRTHTMQPPVLAIDPAVFDPANIREEAKEFDRGFRAQLAKETEKWYHIGAGEYRRRRKAGETPRPKPILLESASSIDIPSREQGRSIPCRLLKPQHTTNGDSSSSSTSPKAIYLNIHGGGWVLGDHEAADQRLQDIANDHNLVCLSVGYRLAPENPYPAALEDCYDVAEWLVLNAESQYGCRLGFIGGDSAGGHLSMVTALHLLQHSDPRFSEFRLKGLVLHYGCFDLNLTPSAKNLHKHEKNLLLGLEDILQFRDAFVPGWTHEKLSQPDISPLHADLQPLRGKLPPALYTCGTYDCLLDDTLFMSTKWVAAGGEAHLEIMPGAQHG